MKAVPVDFRSEVFPSGGTNVGRSALAFAMTDWKQNCGEIGGNNRGQYVTKILKGLAPEGSSWCAAAVSSWIHAAFPEIAFPYLVSALAIRNALRQRDWLFIDKKYEEDEGGNRVLVFNGDAKRVIEPGNLIIFERGRTNDAYGHIGIVWRYDLLNNVLYTIEGNGGYFSPTDRLQKVWGFKYNFDKADPLLLAVGSLPARN